MISKGSYGTCVYIDLSEDGYERAVKRMVKGTCGNLGRHEKRILKDLALVNSKHIVRYWFYDESDENYAYLILDLCEETLQEYIEKQNLEDLTKEAPSIMRQMLEGLDDLHRGPNKILHRNLKPTNIMRHVQGDWTLTDFGISRMLPEDQTILESEGRETTFWEAPPSLESFPDFTTGFARYRKQSDIQALRMVCFGLLTKGKHPSGIERGRLRNVLDVNPVGLDNLADPMAKDLISWMLQHNPKDRPHAHEALKHPYLQPTSEQFKLLACVGHEREIQKRDSSCDVVNEINNHPLLFKSTWKSQIPSDVYEWLCSNGKPRFPRFIVRPPKYGNEWTECLRLISRLYLRPNHFTGTIGEPQDYFLKVFPTLPVVVHRVIRSHSDWTSRISLAKFFDDGK